ncbi:hypothetical protein [Streptosporangium sp. CA-115845]|uniref:VG15 protein n=1 Tax=Streptosporangium sp. CA-115845 TaxID=3240071 RepID=UPI003D8B1199
MSAAEQKRAAAAYQAQQRVVSSSLVRDLVKLLKMLFNVERAEESWPATQMALAAMVVASRQQSANLAGPYYQRLRTAVGLPGGIVPAEPRELTPDRLSAALDSAGMAVMRRSLRLGATSAQARDRMAVTLSGTATRLALEGGRDVMEATSYDDEDALGWARIGDGDSCSWCLMLIGRGAVYTSAKTAGDVRYGGAKYHDHDGCQAVPIFDADSPILHRAEELYADWKRITAGHGGEEARKVWRRHWESRDKAAGG